MDKNLINFLIIIISLILLFSLTIAKEQTRDNSAVLARIQLLRMGKSATNVEEIASRPTRQTTGNGISFKGQKAKRYRCYLMDDNDDVKVGIEIDDQHKGQIIKEHEGKSFFVGFQRDRNEKNENNILGWEERNLEGPRRAEGTQSRYLFSGKRRTTEGPATEKPIIEYLDYEGERIGNEQPNKVENATPISPVQFSRTTKTMPNLDSKFLQILQRAKISRRPLPYVEKEQPRKLSLSLESNGESGADEEPETGKELEEEENYNDIYITTTTPTTTSSRKSALRRPPTNSLPRAQGTPAPYIIKQLKQRREQIPPRAIPHESGAVEEEQEEKEEIHPMRPTTQQPFHNFAAQLQPNSQSTPLIRKINAAPNLWPGQQQFVNTQYNQQQLLFPQQQQQQPQSTAQRNQNPQKDSQGRVLILSPEHCKMMDNYAQIYGLRSPTNVMNFVHNNCAFAKIYLPAASCAEIDILVQSCYQKRN